MPGLAYTCVCAAVRAAEVLGSPPEDTHIRCAGCGAAVVGLRRCSRYRQVQYWQVSGWVLGLPGMRLPPAPPAQWLWYMAAAYGINQCAPPPACLPPTTAFLSACLPAPAAVTARHSTGPSTAPTAPDRPPNSPRQHLGMNMGWRAIEARALML